MERPANSDELPVYLDYLKDTLKRLDYQDYCNAMSDDFYYTSGRKAAFRREISWVESEIAETERLLALTI